MDSGRLAAQRRSLPFYDWYATSPHQPATVAEGVTDLRCGNPHDPPLPAYVEALRRHLEPQHPGWFAYMFDHPEAVAVVADDLARHTGLPWQTDDVAMTNGGWGAIAVAV